MNAAAVLMAYRARLARVARPPLPAVKHRVIDGTVPLTYGVRAHTASIREARYGAPGDGEGDHDSR